jgi:ABC-type enterochelin transport system substrate-binding protein
MKTYVILLLCASVFMHACSNSKKITKEKNTVHARAADNGSKADIPPR